MDASTRAVLTAALSALVAASAFTEDVDALAHLGRVPVMVAAVVLALMIAVGWPVLLRLPNPLGSGVVVALGGVGAVLTVTATRGHPLLRELAVVVALAVLLAFVNELARQDGRKRLVESLAGTVTGVLIATAAAGWVSAGRAPGGTSLVVTGAVALAVAAAVSAVPLEGYLGATVTGGASVVAGGAVGVVMPNLDVFVGAVLGLGMGVLVAALHALFDRQPALRSKIAAMAVVALPVAVSGILVYVVGRVLLG